jgi:glycosyltransferase involved in cell wall biosynthesis
MSKKNNKKYPFVSICTPTFNRRPFIEIIIKCFNSQTYPKNRMEWIIIDDGTDKIEELFKNVPQVKYFKYDEKMNLGQKRNIMHEKSKGEIIIYFDDDDYYPPERVSHAVETLQKNPNIMIAGSSEMYIYFKHIQKMYKAGPYGPMHSTAATFAIRREYLKQSRFEDSAALAEERFFLKNFSEPLVQMDPMKTILVFSHDHNTFDKKKLLEQGPNQFFNVSDKTVDDFIKDPQIKKFFMEDIDDLLKNYEPGRIENKPEVLKQIEELKVQREKMIQDQQNQYQQQMQQQFQNCPPQIARQIMEQNNINQLLNSQNIELKQKVQYLETKIKEIIQNQIEQKKQSQIHLST